MVVGIDRDDFLFLIIIDDWKPYKSAAILLQLVVVSEKHGYLRWKFLKYQQKLVGGFARIISSYSIKSTTLMNIAVLV